MVFALVSGIVLLLVLLLLLANIGVSVFFYDLDIEIKLIILKVIKIKLKEKTIFEKAKKSNIVKRRIPISIIIDIFEDSLPHLKYFASVSSLKADITLDFGLSAADKTAIAYGLINMLFYNAGNLFYSAFKEYTGNYDINPDFIKEKLEFRANMRTNTRLFHLIVFSIKMGSILLRYRKYIFRKGGALNAGTSNRGLNENYNG